MWFLKTLPCSTQTSGLYLQWFWRGKLPLQIFLMTTWNICKMQVWFYLSDCIKVNLRGSRIPIFLGGPCPQTPLDNTLYSFPPKLKIVNGTLDMPHNFCSFCKWRVINNWLGLPLSFTIKWLSERTVLSEAEFNEKSWILSTLKTLLNQQ